MTVLTTPARAADAPRGVLLLVEDDVDHAFLVRRRLAAYASLELAVVHLGTAAAAVERLREGDVQCVLLDLTLPDAHDLEAVEALRAVDPRVPIVVLTGLDSDAAGLRALQVGAQDYLVKGRHDLDAVGRAVVYALERTRRQRAEQSRAQLAERLELLLEASAEGIVWVDRDGLCTFVNRAAAQMLGSPVEELLGRDLHAAFHVCPPGVDPCPVLAILRTSEPIDAGEQLARRADGGLAAMELRARPVVDGTEGVVLNFTDVTERRRAQTALAGREAQLVDAQRLAGLGSWEWDLGSDDVTWSDELHRLTGLDPADVPADSRAFTLYTGLVPEPDRDAVARLFREARRSEVVEVRHRLVRPDGSLRWLHCLVSPVGDPTGSRVVGTIQDVTEQQAAEEALAHQALHDALTGLANRSLLLDRLERALALSARGEGLVAVVFIDLDRFKWVNDSISHAAGDRLLVEVADVLRDGLRAGDTLARVGGDEFVVLCERVHEEAEVLGLADRLARALDRQFVLDGRDVPVSASMGVALAGPHQPTTAEDLIRDADTAMYRAKERGRARYELFDEDMRRRVSAQLEVQTGLRRAVTEGELVVHYQPVVDLLTGRVRGAEALVRWQHPERGLLPPDAFIRAAEETGIIVALGETVLGAACRQAAAWNAGRDADELLSMAVNLSARQLSDPGLVESVAAALADARLDPSLLCLEITETVLMEDVATSGAVLTRLRDLGARVAVDDFGTGYSSLAYLRTLPVDELKVDRSFVSGLGDEGPGTAIVTAVTALAQALRLSVVAEGVETQAQLRTLVGLGVQSGQGFLWSRPVAAGAASWVPETGLFALAGASAGRRAAPLTAAPVLRPVAPRRRSRWS